MARRAGTHVSNHGPVPPSEQGKRRITYDVRIWKTRTLKGARGRSYQVRWTVAGKIHYATFATKALADSKEAQLKTAAREGEAFDIAAGLPLSAVSGGRDHEVSWYEFACAYTDMKWEEVAPNSRRAIADALATATPALLSTRRGAPKPEQLRKALYGWAFNTRLRATAPPPQLAAAATWAQRNTVALGDLGDPDTLRRVLNQLARKLDGTPAAATVVARKRAVLFNLLGYAVDKKHFAMNPMLSMRWTSPKAAEAIDRRRVVNARQAEALLEAVSAQGPMGRHLAGFFGAMYHAGLRPSEAVMLTLDELQIPDEEGKWGWLHLGSSAPPEAPGTRLALAASDDSSSTARPRKSVRSPSRRRWPSCSAITSLSTAPHPTDACSAVRLAGCSPTPCTAAHGTKPGTRLSPRPRQHHRSPNGLTTCATPAYPPGSTQASPPPRSPNGLATASRSCSASTPNAWPTPRRPPSSASKKPRQEHRADGTDGAFRYAREDARCTCAEPKRSSDPCPISYEA